MENASKALVIAGAILISLLIIALGVYIFGQAGSTTDVSQLSALEVSAFNGKFDKYKGIQNGTQVSALLDALISNGRISDNKPAVSFIPGAVASDEATDATWKIPASNATAATAATTFGTIAAPTEGVVQSAMSNTIYTSSLKNLKNIIQSSHRYKVVIRVDDNSDLINGIGISAQN